MNNPDPEQVRIMPMKEWDKVKRTVKPSGEPLGLRVTPQLKSAIYRAADKAGMNMTDWLTQVIEEKLSGN